MNEIQIFHSRTITGVVDILEPAFQEHGILQRADRHRLIAVDAFHGQAVGEGVAHVDVEVAGNHCRLGVGHGVYRHAGTAQGNGFLDVRAEERAGRKRDDIPMVGGIVGFLQGTAAVVGRDGTFMVQRGQQGRLGGSSPRKTYDREQGEKEFFSHNNIFLRLWTPGFGCLHLRIMVWLENKKGMESVQYLISQS